MSSQKVSVTWNGASVNRKKTGYDNGYEANSQENTMNDDPDSLRTVGDIHNPYSFEIVNEIADYLLKRVPHRPLIGVICGSGMGGLANLLEEAYSFPYEEIPHFPVSTVPGHAGRLVFGKIDGVEVVAMQGRLHHYEGYPLWKCAMPVRVMKLIGCKYLIVSNAAGGLNPNFKVGDIMIVRDHINIMGFAGNGPLQGLNDERFGTRFPAMTRAYEPKLIKAAHEIASTVGIDDIKEGVYTALGGPNFETVAELRFLRVAGVDAVGMSTVHEVIVARHSNMKVFAFSLITNMCATEYETESEANHAEVMDVGSKRGPVIQNFVQKMIVHIGATHSQSRSETGSISDDNGTNSDEGSVLH